MDNVKISKNDRLHFIGIGGAGMSSLAIVCLAKGFQISGSDIKDSVNTRNLRKAGASICIGHKAESVDGASIVIVSSAIRQTNSELMRARELGIPVWIRAQLLAYLMKEKRSIAVAGTHGKTTTTSMISLMLDESGLDPTFLIGGELNDIGSGARFGEGDYLVAEADESDGSLLCLAPKIVVLTNIEEDHLDYYNSIDEIEKVFLDFMKLLPKDGFAVVCFDDPIVQKIIPEVPCKCYTYGFDSSADFWVRNVKLKMGKTSFEVMNGNECLGEIVLTVPGNHNVYNALGTLTLGVLLGVSFKQIKKSLDEFCGVRRRFQYKGEEAQITVVDDYAHHPSEVKATLEAAQTGDWKRVVSVFQPHRYSRTSYLHVEFGKSFSQADMVIITDVYAADEEPVPGVDGKMIVDSILVADPSKDVAYFPKKADIGHYLLGVLDEGDLLLTLGAGDVWAVGEEVLDELKLNGEKDTS